MTNLTDYDREIVAAAEALYEYNQADSTFLTIPNIPSLCRVYDAVEAKREAQKPLCDFPSQSDNSYDPAARCNAVAVQEISRGSSQVIFRCEEHRIEVREL